MRLADVLETVPAYEHIRIFDTVGEYVVFNGSCCDFRATSSESWRDKFLLRKVDKIHANSYRDRLEIELKEE